MSTPKYPTTESADQRYLPISTTELAQAIQALLTLNCQINS